MREYENGNNRLWHRLVADNTALTAGWHLARNEVRGDFAEDIPMVDAFGYDHEAVLTEIRRSLATSTFEPKPLIKIDVPKGSLGIRPGSLISLHDRIVLFAILRLISRKLDQLLPDGVYSYRVKKGEDRNSLFEETDVIDLPFFQFPFLKRATITKRVDPFEPWYALWPKFDEASRAVIKEYPYLSVSDISAYFENISLQILRHMLDHALSGEPKIINTIMQCFEAWAVRTEDGFRPFRGIPQGTNISSFFGNFFLRTLDETFQVFGQNHDIKYFRYMDDVRIFSKDEITARQVIFHMDQAIRRQHLNVQSAKTKILKGHEISDELIDERVEKLKVLQDEITSAIKQKDTGQLNRIRSELKKVAREKPKSPHSQKLIGSNRPIKNLSLRAYRMWINCNMRLGDGDYLSSLFREIKRNPDHRLTRAFVNAMKAFPRKSQYPQKVLEFISSDLNIYSLQEAELLHALRYCSRLNPEVREKMVNIATSSEHYFYVRVQACNLLTRFNLDINQLNRLKSALLTEQDEMVLTALALPVGQFREQRNTAIVRILVHHPNTRVALLGKHLRHVKNDEGYSSRYLKFVFEKNSEMRVCDHLGVLSYIAQSRVPRILIHLQKSLEEAGPKHIVMDMRGKLAELAMECQRNLVRHQQPA
ncbi:reverse transcriptase domain-containing protein [Parvibaculum sp.]|uniref:RNA-directed DNA polymerase n=1 Tax=Parvibaculum sp. TaxID=2024848 RepID=UPI003BAD5894